MQIQFSEKELRNFLSNKNNLKKYLDLRFIAKEVSIYPAEYIDILAYDKQSNCYVIINLNTNLIDFKSFTKGISQLQYYQDSRFLRKKPRRKFALLFIGQKLDCSLTRVVKYNFNMYENNGFYYNLFDLVLGDINFQDIYDDREQNYRCRLNQKIEKICN